MMNKKGQTFLSLIELILFIFLFIVVIGFIFADMNDIYNKNYDPTPGIDLTNQINSLQSYKSDIVNDTSSGQAQLTDFGILKLVTTGKILLQAATIIWSFVSGSFIYTLVNMMNLGVYSTITAEILQIFYIIVVAFILIKLVLRINA